MSAMGGLGAAPVDTTDESHLTQPRQRLQGRGYGLKGAIVGSFQNMQLARRHAANSFAFCSL